MIEAKLRLLATKKGIYVMALLDLPRVPPLTRGIGVDHATAADADDIE